LSHEHLSRGMLVTGRKGISTGGSVDIRFT